MRLLKQSTARHVTFYATLASDHISPATGLSGTMTVTLSKNAAAFAAASGALSEISSGWYKLALDATDTNTIGDLLLHASVATMDNVDAILGQVVSSDPNDIATASALTVVDDFVDTEVADIVTRVTDIQARLPASLDSGNIKASVKAMDANVITATVIAADAIGASELAADAVTEIQSGLATASALATVSGFVDTEVADIVTRVTDIQARIPVSLDFGNMRSAVKAMDAGIITASVIAADAIGASELAADAVAEIQSGLATSASLSTVAGFVDTEVADLVTRVTDVQARLPASLIGGNMRSNVQAMANNVVTAAAIATDAIDADALAADAIAEIGGGGGSGVAILASPVTNKLQFTSNENLKIVFPPFIDRTTGDPHLGTDAVTLVIKRPSGTVMPGPPTPTFDTDVELWTASINTGSFIAGTWLILATSDGAGTQGQRQVLTWGDYVDDIPETRQAALGRWRIDATAKKLFLYEDDGTTVFKEFDLKDASGVASVTQVFERDPV